MKRVVLLFLFFVCIVFANAQIQIGQDIYGEAASDNSGRSVSLSSDGKTLAIGAYYNDGSGNDAGHVRVYSLNGSVWTQKGIDIDGEVAGDGSGDAVFTQFGWQYRSHWGILE